MFQRLACFAKARRVSVVQRRNVKLILPQKMPAKAINGGAGNQNITIYIQIGVDSKVVSEAGHKDQGQLVSLSEPGTEPTTSMSGTIATADDALSRLPSV
jgi:hypothetical protein